MNFKDALEQMTLGNVMKRLAGNHLRVFLVKGSIDRPAEHIAEDSVGRSNYVLHGIPFSLFEAGDVGTITRLPRFDAIDSNGNTVTGWLPSATDLLSEDWILAGDSNEPQ